MIQAIENNQRPSKLTKVIHGANDDEFNLAGATVGSVRESLFDAFNIPADALAFVDGVHVDFGYRLVGGETLEFCKQRGRKGLGRLLSPSDLMECWGIDTDQYERWISEGLPIEQLVDGSTGHFEAAVDEWCRARVRVRSSKNPPALQSKWLRLKDAAALVGVSCRQLARYAEQGKIAHKRKPGRGRGGRGEYLFLPEDVEKFNARMTIPAKMDRTAKAPMRPPVVKTRVFIDPKTCGRSI